MKVQDYSQMIGHMTRDKTTDVPGSMAHGLRTGLYDGGRANFRLGKKVQLTKDMIESMASENEGMLSLIHISEPTRPY